MASIGWSALVIGRLSTTVLDLFDRRQFRVLDQALHPPKSHGTGSSVLVSASVAEIVVELEVTTHPPKSHGTGSSVMVAAGMAYKPAASKVVKATRLNLL